jgi:putative hydrolases of HD superfamily
MGSRTADAVVRAYLEAARLKSLPRKGWLLRGVSPDDCESVADHTQGVAMLCLLLLDGRGLDRERVLHMALLHDLGEARVGDITPSDGVSDDDKHQLEAAAVRDISEGLSGGERHRAIWEEYEAGATPEARFVKQVDKLEMALQAAAYDRQGYDGLNEFFESARRAIDDPDLLQLLDAADPVLTR